MIETKYKLTILISDGGRSKTDRHFCLEHHPNELVLLDTGNNRYCPSTEAARLIAYSHDDASSCRQPRFLWAMSSGSLKADNGGHIKTGHFEVKDSYHFWFFKQGVFAVS